MSLAWWNDPREVRQYEMEADVQLDNPKPLSEYERSLLQAIGMMLAAPASSNEAAQ
jgi:hypothetical protein